MANEFIIGVQSAQRALKKKVPRGRTQMTIEPGWGDDPEPIPPVDQRESRQLTDSQRKLKRLQRA